MTETFFHCHHFLVNGDVYPGNFHIHLVAVNLTQIVRANRRLQPCHIGGNFHFIFGSDSNRLAYCNSQLRTNQATCMGKVVIAMDKRRRCIPGSGGASDKLLQPQNVVVSPRSARARLLYPCCMRARGGLISSHSPHHNQIHFVDHLDCLNELSPSRPVLLRSHISEDTHNLGHGGYLDLCFYPP